MFKSIIHCGQCLIMCQAIIIPYRSTATTKYLLTFEELHSSIIENNIAHIMKHSHAPSLALMVQNYKFLAVPWRWVEPPQDLPGKPTKTHSLRCLAWPSAWQIKAIGLQRSKTPGFGSSDL